MRMRLIKDKSVKKKKGYAQQESPEKMSGPTVGIDLNRNNESNLREQLTGGNQPADETNVARLVTEYISAGL